jgi:sec-independent protein translocase protein TatA
MNVFGIGLPEMAVIAAIGLLVFGPKRLPELGKTLGKTLRGFQSASQEFEKEFRQAVAPDFESSGSQIATPLTSPSPSGSNEIAVLPGAVPTKDPEAQPSSLSPAPSEAIAAGIVPASLFDHASDPAAGTIPSPAPGDTPGI